MFGFLLFFSLIGFVAFGLFLLRILYILVFLDNLIMLEVKHLPGMMTFALVAICFMIIYIFSTWLVCQLTLDM